MAHFTHEKHGEVHDTKKTIALIPTMTFEQLVNLRIANREKLDVLKVRLAEAKVSARMDKQYMDADDYRALKYLVLQYGRVDQAACTRLAVMKRERQDASRKAHDDGIGQARRKFCHYAAEALPDPLFESIARKAGFTDEMIAAYLHRDFEKMVTG